eukprot:SAG11_NODE_35467_length_266_cov_0.928144_1_plen_88_part_11
MAVTKSRCFAPTAETATELMRSAEPAFCRKVHGSVSTPWLDRQGPATPGTRVPGRKGLQRQLLGALAWDPGPGTRVRDPLWEIATENS